MLDFSYLSNLDPAAAENMYRLFKKDKNSVGAEWRMFFEGFDFSQSHFELLPENEAEASSTEDPRLLPRPAIGIDAAKLEKEFKLIKLIESYRTRGHLFTKTNPVRDRRDYSPTLDHRNFGFSDEDLEEIFQGGSLTGVGTAKLKAIIQDLEETFCRSIGCEYKFIRNIEMVEWIERRFHRTKNKPNFTDEEKHLILKKINEAVVFESFLQTRFVGQKRFSMEGMEALIPALETVVEFGASRGIREFVIGMAHRGRLNILANILGKSCESIFSEFEGKGYEDAQFGGDVKYHMGFSADKTTHLSGKKVHLSLCPNPSHLEAVNAMVEGIVRAKIDKRYENDHSQIAPILIHGDASISGQGILYELIQMSDLDGYRTGGTIHIILNNQIGFTTNYLEGRTSTYCTDIGKVAKCPILHVNGDDVEAVVFAVLFALDFRQEFHQDVFIDILGYRRYGHNEGDDPRFTQPLLYEKISKHPNLRSIYCRALMEEGVIDEGHEERITAEFRNYLDRELKKAKALKNTPMSSYLKGDWKSFRLSEKGELLAPPMSGVAYEKLKCVADRLFSLPEDKPFYAKVRKIYHDRRTMVIDSEQADWAVAETLAYATLLDQGYGVRISGQDCRRGTFSHRHALIRSEDEKTNYFPLEHVSNNQGPFRIHNSILSEYGVLGFEYGYAHSSPNTLTVWEAQFGDFANGAQIIIDQFIASAETKWLRMNGITLFLPHGYEGQGPEHSSARIERFLALCADENMQVANCTTPANFFHLLRKQMLVPYRKPLVVFTPKSLLRHPGCVSDLNEMTENTHFASVLDDRYVQDREKVVRILFCSGKIFYDLSAHQLKQQRGDVAVIRLEQLYPLPAKLMDEVVASYPNAREVFWVQEEPENQGPWSFLFMNHFRNRGSVSCCARKPYSSTAGGFAKLHQDEQNQIVTEAFQVS